MTEDLYNGRSFLREKFGGKISVEIFLWEKFCGKISVEKFLWKNFCGKKSVEYPNLWKMISVEVWEKFIKNGLFLQL